MLVKWIKSILGNQTNEVTDQVTKESRPKMNKAELLDVANEAMRSESDDLDQLVRVGFHHVKRSRLKKKIRGQVQGSVNSLFDDSEIVEEITERILNAAEVDPFYAKLFGTDDKRNS